MGLLSNLKAKVENTLMGELVLDLGSLRTGEDERELGFSIRRRPGKPAHLQVKLSAPGGADHFQITRMKECADEFERVAREIRKHL